MRLQSRCWPGLGSYLKAPVGKDPLLSSLTCCWEDLVPHGLLARVRLAIWNLAVSQHRHFFPRERVCCRMQSQFYTLITKVISHPLPYLFVRHYSECFWEDVFG